MDSKIHNSKRHWHELGNIAQKYDEPISYQITKIFIPGIAIILNILIFGRKQFEKCVSHFVIILELVCSYVKWCHIKIIKIFHGYYNNELRYIFCN